MSYPDNKYCTKCAEYEGEIYDEIRTFYEKYGRPGCSGIPHRSGEFPYDAHAHCFTTQTPLTEQELTINKIEAVERIIKNAVSPKTAAQTIVNKWKVL